MKKQRLISRLVAGSLVLLLPVLSLCGCTSSQNQVSAPTSPEQLGYTIDRQQIPQVVMEDSLFLNQETFYCPELSGNFTAVGAYWYDYLGSDAYPVAFLQAVPANTTKIKLPSGEISVSDWEQYQIFKDKDVIIYDLYPMLYPEGTVPERVAQEVERSYYQTQEEYQAGKIPQERYFNEPLNSRLTQTRYLNYLWEYYHQQLPQLIQKSSDLK